MKITNVINFMKLKVVTLFEYFDGNGPGLARNISVFVKYRTFHERHQSLGKKTLFYNLSLFPILIFNTEYYLSNRFYLLFFIVCASFQLLFRCATYRVL